MVNTFLLIRELEIFLDRPENVIVIMKFINLILDGDKIKKACFLCFEHGENQLFEEIIIHDSKFSLKTSLYKIAKYLMPSYDILFNQACKDCSDIIIKMFSVLQDHLYKKDMLEKIAVSLNENIPNSINVQNKCIINLGGSNTKSDGIATATNSEQNVNIEQSSSCLANLTSGRSLKESFMEQSKLNDRPETVICHICGKICINRKTLKSHINCHVGKQCPYCNKMLKSHSHFNKHVKNHKIQRTVKRMKNIVKCPSCTYYGHNKSDLEAHTNKVHLKIKPYQCEECLKCFYKKSNLSAHKIIHLELKMLICEVCGQGFAHKKTLSEHLRLHSGEKMFKCDICQRTYTTQSRRNEHMKRNHSNEFINCSFCEKKYTLKKELNYHIKKFHQQIS